jgi:hypothetical protein
MKIGERHAPGTGFFSGAISGETAALLRVTNGVDLAMIRGLEITDAISASPLING